MLFYWKAPDGSEVAFDELPDLIIQSATKFALLETMQSGIELYPAYTFKVPACRARVSDLPEAGECIAKRFSLFLIDLNEERDADILDLVACLRRMLQANPTAQFVLFASNVHRHVELLLSELGTLEKFKLCMASLYDVDINRRIKARINYIKGSCAIESLVPSDTALDLCQKLLRGEIEHRDAIEHLLKEYNLDLNKYGHIKVRGLSEKRLEQIGADIFSVNTCDLFLYPEKPLKFSAAFLSRLHLRLFHPLPFAGRVRRVDISKDCTRFEPHIYVKESLKSLMNSINQIQWSRLPSKEDAVQLTACLMAELNYSHPFSGDGNGRTAREFFRILLSQSKFEVQWVQGDVSAYKFLSAMKVSVWDDSFLKTVLERCIIERKEQ